MSLMTTGPVHAWIGWTSAPQQYQESSSQIVQRYQPTVPYPTVSTSASSTFTVPTMTPPSIFDSILASPYAQSVSLLVGGVANFLSQLAQSSASDEAAAAADDSKNNPPPLISSGVPTQNIYYLGTGEEPPQIRIRSHYRNVYSLDVGKEVPYDKAYLGRDAVITMTLNEWNEAAYRLVAARTNTRSTNLTPRGTDAIDSIGSLLASEGLALTLWLQFPTTQSQQKINGLPDGYRFVCAYPVEELITPGTTANRLKLTWHAWKLFSNQSSQGQVLFDHDMSAVPPLVNVYGYTIGH